MQRIQSLFLLIAIVLGIPAATFTHADILSHGTEIIRISAFRSYNFHTASGHTGLLNFIELFLLLLGMLVSAYTIGQFKKRSLQMKLCVANIFVQIATLALFALQLKPYFENHSSIQYYAPIIFPLLSIVFIWLAYKGVKKDEEKIKSIDRIR